ncbi:54S ribosomal protein L9, mitochondrial [Wickerhamiella sorbophila]|uniref:Large ribosomal subunit protein uL3m n=1 Tax=Wickerhamiella sorbophila TaxID=45607 RepID=A0A2T0FGE4_9ASCO|nr:54S ribosomal protein L9, mitochondrial [Wickerhamiella sorbophila]PRT54061.1 54S ribosomal protein L9, mitochondrial [Wickerhamiella sorbophila]
MRVFKRFMAQLTAKSVVNTYQSEAPALFESAAAAHARRRLRNRVGLLAYKRGMVPYYLPDGTHFACTVLEVDRCQVTDVKTADKHGYFAVQLGIGSRKVKNTTRPMLGHFARSEVAPKRHLVEFQVRDESGLLPLGSELKADHLIPGQFVDVKSRTKGKGFQGVMKRWGFGGMSASHGTSGVHRSAGSTGQNTDPARVFPGKKMAGRMGYDFRTVQNLQILEVDADNGLILVRGSIGGADGRLVKITDAVKKPLPKA